MMTVPFTGLLPTGTHLKPKGVCLMKRKKVGKVPLKAIEKMATQGKDVNSYFTKGKMKPPLKSIQRVNVDFTAQMLNELDKLAHDLNISRQAVIKSFLRVAIDQHLQASKGRKQRAS
jgi:hypothetical protein